LLHFVSPTLPNLGIGIGIATILVNIGRLGGQKVEEVAIERLLLIILRTVIVSIAK